MAEGADPGKVDRALQDFGLALGPFRLLDDAGFGAAVRRARRLSERLGVQHTNDNRRVKIPPPRRLPPHRDSEFVRQVDPPKKVAFLLFLA